MRDKKIIISRLTTTFVVVFWLVMMGLLVKKDFFPLAARRIYLGPREILSKGILTCEKWMGIYYGDTKIGYSHHFIEAISEGGFPGYRVSNLASLTFSMLGEARSIRFGGSSYLDDDFRLRKFDFFLESGFYSLKLAGEMKKGGLLAVNILSGGELFKKELSVKEDIFLSNALVPQWLFHNYLTKKEIKLNIFDPILLAPGEAIIRIKGREKVSHKGKLIEVLVVEVEYQGINSVAWVDSKGEVVREETSLGLKMVKEDLEEAMGFKKGKLEPKLDILSAFSIDSNVAIPNSREVKYLKAELSDLNGTSHVVEVFSEDMPRENTALPIKGAEYERFLMPTPFIQCDNEDIIQCANEIVEDQKDAWSVALKIMNWVYGQMKPSFSLGFPSALDVLRLKVGDCNEYTVLFSALSRAAGIPTKISVGLVYYNGRFYYHAWPKVFVGRWINMDPTFGQAIADATHIELAEGDLDKQIEIVKLIGNLKLKVIEYE